MKSISYSYWATVWRQFCSHRVGIIALWVVALFVIVGVYAPLLASSKPLLVVYDGHLYFPLFRYLFYSGFYTKKIDIFFNLLMATLPLAVVARIWLRGRWRTAVWMGLAALQLGLFLYFGWVGVRDPAADLGLVQARRDLLTEEVVVGGDPLLAPFPKRVSWEFDLASMNEYGRLNQLLRYEQRKEQHKRFADHYQFAYAEQAKRRWLASEMRARRRELAQQEPLSQEALVAQILADTPQRVLDSVTALPTLWQEGRRHLQEELLRQKEIVQTSGVAYQQAKQRWPLLRQRYLADPLAGRSALATARSAIDRYEVAEAKERYLKARQRWLKEESAKITFQIPAFIRPFHWQEDAGGEQSLNQYVRWYDLTRINRKDLVASLLFGVRVSLVVGAAAVAISLLLGIPIGAIAGYYGGRTDLVVSRGIEIWESMPVFFMLLMVVAILQTKSVFIVIAVLGVFGWTGFSRFLRGEVLKQRNLAYVEACRSMGYSNWRILFSHILPNAIPPLLTLLPFSVMAAITSEAGLSFLGLGEEGSASWGVLMDEGRSAFPAESYLLWPPAIMLTILLVAIALVGDALRDSLDPKMRH